MPPKQVNYSDIVALLDELGFQDESVEGSHQAFHHLPSDTLILLGPSAPNDRVRKEDLVSVRRHLDFKGLMEAAAFDRRFPQAVAMESS
jgi:predicted RNA binding protein YcfA (HicA-like mRNA interferase family)